MENGKWVHMMDSAHTGFRNWDDNDWTYPQIRMVNPIPRGKIVVSFRGNSRWKEQVCSWKMRAVFVWMPAILRRKQVLKAAALR